MHCPNCGVRLQATVAVAHGGDPGEPDTRLCGTAGGCIQDVRDRERAGAAIDGFICEWRRQLGDKDSFIQRTVEGQIGAAQRIRVALVGSRLKVGAGGETTHHDP